MSEVIPYSDVRDMALAVFQSGFTGCKKPEEVLALMMLAQAEGKHPAIIQRDYHMVSGRPTLKADTMLARFQESGGDIEYTEYSDTRCSMIFKHPRGGKLEVSWDMNRAQQAGVTGNPTWKKYPRAMLRARCISEGIRSVYPGCVAGVYTPEEVQDMEPQKQTQEVDMGKAEVVVEEIKKAKEKKEGETFLPLYVPGMDEPFSESTDLAEWEISFHDMVHKIKASQKLSDNTKRDKLKMLKDANGEVIDKLDAPTKMKVMAAANSLEEV
jgi:hypothetical protein